MDITIECIRLDYARPTITARNLFHVYAAPGGLTVMPKLNALMVSLGYDITDTSTSGVNW